MEETDSIVEDVVEEIEESNRSTDVTTLVLIVMSAIMVLGNLCSWWSVPWVWALAPIWIPYALVGVIILLLLSIIAGVCLIGCIAMLIEAWRG